MIRWYLGQGIAITVSSLVYTDHGITMGVLALAILFFLADINNALYEINTKPK
mgnify:CR=1 FL=1